MGLLGTLLAGLGFPDTASNEAAVSSWAAAEGGSAAYNPFNTTLAEPGASSYNSVGVRNYTSQAQGLAATRATLQGSSYAAIRADLAASAPWTTTMAAVNASPWGTRTAPAASTAQGEAALAAHGLTAEPGAAAGGGRSFTFVLPVQGATWKNDFGVGTHAKPGAWENNGIDMLAPAGTPVYAPFAGVLRLGSGSDGSIGGNRFHVVGVDGVTAYGAHLQGFAKGVRTGQTVSPGQLIGYVGNTGDAAGGPTHLHFDLGFGPSDTGQSVNPYGLLQLAKTSGGTITGTVGGGGGVLGSITGAVGGVASGAVGAVTGAVGAGVGAVGGVIGGATGAATGAVAGAASGAVGQAASAAGGLLHTAEHDLLLGFARVALVVLGVLLVWSGLSRSTGAPGPVDTARTVVSTAAKAGAAAAA